MKHTDIDVRNLSLEKYLTDMGYSLTRTKGKLEIKELPGIRVDPVTETYYTAAPRPVRKYGILDFVMEFTEYDTLRRAVDHLTEYALTRKNDDIRSEEKSDPVLPEIPDKYLTELPEPADDNRRAYAYLRKARGISSTILNRLMRHNGFYQDRKHGNCVFVGYDASGKYPVFCALLSSNPLTGYFADDPGNNYDIGCLFRNDRARNLFVTTRITDALAHASVRYEITRGTDEFEYLSLGSSANIEAVRYWIRHRRYDSVVLGLENSRNGRIFTRKAEELLKEENYKGSVSVQVPKHICWNMDLMALIGMDLPVTVFSAIHLRKYDRLKLFGKVYTVTEKTESDVSLCADIGSENSDIRFTFSELNELIKMSYAYLSEEEIDLNAFDLVKQNVRIEDYAEYLGMTVLRRGSILTTREHDSLVIRPDRNIYYRNSTQTGGSIIDFVMEFTEYDTPSKAVAHLMDYAGLGDGVPVRPRSSSAVSPRSFPKELKLPEHASGNRRVFAYLMKIRCIDSEIIAFMIGHKYLYQDTRNNCVFVGYDDRDNPCFGMLRSAFSFGSFKGDVPGCDYSWGMLVDNEADTLVITESAIDAMSCMDLMKRRGSDFRENNYLVLGSTSKWKALSKRLRQYDYSRIILALDNDEAGRTGNEKMREYLSVSGFEGEVITVVPCNKDWNEDLKTIAAERNQHASGSDY